MGGASRDSTGLGALEEGLISRNEMLAQLSAKLSSNMVDGKEYLMRMC